MFSGGETVVVGVSGGPDSTCLLHVLGRLGADLGLLIAHVDHGLSEDSDAIAADVSSRAAAGGYEVHLARARDLEGPNLHARGREFRYSFFSGLADKEGAARIATGHTLDDRVETTLARLIHGAGTDGLAGIPPREGPRVRPLIDIRRSETRAYCDELGLRYIDDPANEDPRFERSAVRSQVLGAIEARWGEGAIRAMANSAARLTEDSSALKGLAERIYAEIAETEGDSTSLALDQVLGIPTALRRRMLEAAVGRVRDRSGGIDAALEALNDPDRKPDLSFSVAEGVEITIAAGRVTVTKP